MEYDKTEVKNRDALTADTQKKALHCLSRYPATATAEFSPVCEFNLGKTVLKTVLESVYEVVLTDLADGDKPKFIEETGKYCTAFLGKYEKKGKKTLNSILESSTVSLEYRTDLKASMEVKSSGGLFRKLFK